MDLDRKTLDVFFMIRGWSDEEDIFNNNIKALNSLYIK